MARIDRLNYRDIGVIKAPLCRGPLYEGVEEARDSTPGVKILAFPRPRFLPPLLAGIPSPSRGHLPRATATLC